MTLEVGIHPIQAQILRVLLFRPQARFSELNLANISTDRFAFHLKRLLTVGLIEKKGQNVYQLTTGGKEFANRLDTQNVVLERQAKIGTLIGCVKNRGKTTEYLIQKRLKQPYFGFYGFVTGKVKWGEGILEAAGRELKEETGLTGRLTLVGVEHKMDYAKDEKLLEDKYFFIIRASYVKGRLKEEFEGGRNQWLTKAKIFRLPKLFDDVRQILEILNQDKIVFSENKYTVARY